MLNQARMIGFVLTTDYEAARRFYEGKLGFAFESLDQFALVMKVGGHQVRIARVEGFQALRSTVLGWEVADIEAVVRWLIGQGVEMEKYPWVADKELGIWKAPGGAQIAWFKDPDGNVLSVSQHVGA